jgi:hypothetical protein
MFLHVSFLPSFLLANINYTKGFHHDISIYIYNELYSFLSPFPPFLKKDSASSLLNRHSTPWATPSTHFVPVILEIGSHTMPGLTWTAILLFVLPCTAWMTGMCHYAKPLVEMWSHKLFLPKLVLNCNPTNLSSQPPSNSDFRLELLCPVLKQFLTSFIILFSYMHMKCFNCIHPCFTLSFHPQIAPPPHTSFSIF